MKVQLDQPAGFSETGNRPHNEDCIYPLSSQAAGTDSVFLVCDGVGGQEKGEVASALACESLSGYFKANPPHKPLDAYFLRALAFARDTFRRREMSEPQARGMATTLTLLSFGEYGAMMAHLGDSRIYHIRDGHIRYKSLDHKWVNELVQSGVIDEQQAKVHPKRNVISKVLTSDREDVPSLHITNDVKAGDYFFLCTDGVLEHVYDELLTYHLRANHDNRVPLSSMLNAIKEECMGKTGDNFSAYLIRVNSVLENEVIKDEKTLEFGSP